MDAVLGVLHWDRAGCLVGDGDRDRAAERCAVSAHRRLLVLSRKTVSSVGARLPD